jgi:hypothetical protein
MNINNDLKSLKMKRFACCFPDSWPPVWHVPNSSSSNTESTYECLQELKSSRGLLKLCMEFSCSGWLNPDVQLT